jgi:dUTP pyrophosphatase
MVIKLKAVHRNAVAPKRATKRSSGADVYAVEDFVIPAKGWVTADLGLQVADMPDIAGYLKQMFPPGTGIWTAPLEVGLELQVRARSGEARKRGVFVLNEPGTVDQDYRGMMGVILANFSDQEVGFKAGERIAQIVCSLVLYVDYEMTEEVNDTERGAGGFGSTGRA